jgi:two-component system chemotaxis response regulator CheY
MTQCLIVDDSSVVRKVAKRILESEGFPVAQASGGSEALALIRADMPDMIILDATLPDISPVEFITEVLGMAGERKPRIVICLVQLDVPTIMRAKRAGASGYILKPFNRPQLLKRFREFGMAA